MKDEDMITQDFTKKQEKRFSPKALSDMNATKKEVQVIPSEIENPPGNPLNEMITTLKGVIMDDIERVKNDKGYVQQAKAVNNHVNSVINLARLQYDIIKNKK